MTDSRPPKILPAYAVEGAQTPRPDELGVVHFIGIGGAGMSGIARIMQAMGMQISGSDAKESAAVLELRLRGVRCEVGHDAAHLGDADTVVVSSAIRPSNPELAEATKRGLRIIPRAVALASVMSDKRPVAVAGTHGKTSTTSMLVVAAQACGADPSYAIGGELNESGSNAHLGAGDIFVAEADESDGSFLLFSPYAGIVTNVEADHLDNYGDLAAVLRAFDAFIDTIDAAGFVVLCRDDERAYALAERAASRGLAVWTYGQHAESDLQLSAIDVVGTRTTYRARVDGVEHAVDLGAPGAHMALNSAAALLAGIRLGLPAGELIDGLARYAGVHRRMEYVGTASGVRVFDDYAHHPTELAAQLKAARSVAGDGRLIACFQPHLYSRTQAFSTEFGAALGLADDVIVMDVFAAREDPVPGVSGALVAAAVPPGRGTVRFEPSWVQTAEAVAALAHEGDLVMTLGAGDVTMLGQEILAAIESRSS
ncbi:UDP-N-acetylmuramate--L-alanine ligase [Antricoccus suffuscus]|uniref:UDP-N-acetylmuramate--L-alanine ligase n=1 Tax=Antricoccus suffuscus TaxID=1629062 RepID=A0A2T0ZYI5_9ACTN|nr:UDP-N-acetylmuramate--L-alanine ligase [Antricoccus suffuscus]PRZ41415.1 UDP-N-acetylmuramate--L-alanine ligase [Antricoccus suffuscus]